MTYSIFANNAVAPLVLLVLGLAWVILKQNQKRSQMHRQSHKDSTVRENLFDAMDDMVFLCDPHGKIIDCNRTFARFNGINMDDVRKGTMDLEQMIPQLSSTYSCSGNLEKFNEKWLTNHQGEQALIAFHKTPIRDMNGLLTGVVGVGRDITSQWASSEAQKEMKNQLVVTNKDLAEALELAKELSAEADEANKAKSDFLANMSHEIRTPLGAIIGLVDLSLQTDLNAKQAGYINKLDKAAHSLLSIINDILDFSKIEAGKMSTEDVPFNMEEILYQVADMFEDRMMDRSLYFMRKQEDIPNYLIGDPTKLRQILVNLLGNAIKFTETGGITLTVKTRTRYKDKTFLVFSIADTGIGIAPDKIESLFSSFTQADNTTTRRFGGTGLGLALCQKLVDLMGGNIWVQSVEGEGSTFNFALPFQEQTQQQRKKFQELEITNANHICGSPGEPLLGYQILLVDDNEINQEVFSEILLQKGAAVTIAVNGKEAVNRVRGNSYDIVLMDMQMPVMNGLEATEAIRGDLNLPNLPIIALTANATEDDRRLCMAAGMNGHLTKPVNPPDLMEKILNNARPSGPTQSPARTTQSNNASGQNRILMEGRSEDHRIPGLDIKEVMNRLGGKKDLLAKLIKMFLDQHGDDAEKINCELMLGNRKEAISLTHALKGTAGNLSAFRVHKEAQDFEMILRDNDAPLPGEITDSFAGSLQTVLKSMSILLANMNSRQQKTELTSQLGPKEMEHQLTILGIMINNNDILAEDTFLALKSSLSKTVDPQNLAALEQAISIFNFAEAKTELAQIQAAAISPQP